MACTPSPAWGMGVCGGGVKMLEKPVLGRGEKCFFLVGGYIVGRGVILFGVGRVGSCNFEVKIKIA